MATIRNLKIKTSTCKRIVKELNSYKKEVEMEAAKTASMKDAGADPYDIKQQENVLAESRMMIPDCHKRLEASLADLKGILKDPDLIKLWNKPLTWYEDWQQFFGKDRATRQHAEAPADVVDELDKEETEGAQFSCSTGDSNAVDRKNKKFKR